MLAYDDREKNNYQYVVLEIDEELVGISRDQLLRILWAENVIARRYFYPGCHRMEPYRSYYPLAGLVLPETGELLSRVLQLPTGPAVALEQIEIIIQIMKTVFAHSSEISLLLDDPNLADRYASAPELA